MKKFCFLIVFALISALNGKSQVMQQKAQWVTINAPQLKCWTCKDRLEKYLMKEKGPSDDAGIIRWTVNMGAGSIRINYYPDRITPQYLIAAINNAGFDADSSKATEDAYKLLPPICKRPSEGGGPQKGNPCKSPPDGY